MSDFTLERPWTSGDISDSEGEHLHRYHEERDGLLIVEFNVAYPVTGSRARRVDGLLIPDPPSELAGEVFHYSPANRERVRPLISGGPVELIEVHKWGFYGYGQNVGKTHIFKREWDAAEIRSVFIPDNNTPSPFYPDEKPDPATEQTFEEFGIDVVVVK